MKQTILIIDDSKLTQEILSFRLGSAGYQTIAASGQTDALKFFSSNKIDLVVCDMLLAKENGIAVVQEIRRHREGALTPIILMSAVYGNLAYEHKLLKQYDIQFLKKSNNSEELISLVKKLLTSVPAADVAASVKIEGTLRPLAICELVAQFHRDARTGILRIESKAGRADIFFERGCVVFARCGETKSTKEDTYAAISKAFTWVCGQYEFVPVSELPRDIQKFHLPFGQMLYQQVFGLSLGGLTHRYRHQLEQIVSRRLGLRKILPSVPFTAEQMGFIDTIDNKKTVQDLLANLSLAAAEGRYKVLYLLELLNLVDFRETVAMKSSVGMGLSAAA